MMDLRGGFPADMAEAIKELFPHDSFDDLLQDQVVKNINIFSQLLQEGY